MVWWVIPNAAASIPRCSAVKGREANNLSSSESAIEHSEQLYTGHTPSGGKAILSRICSGRRTRDGGWGPWILGDGPGGAYGAIYQENFLRYIVFSDPTFSVLTADLDAAVQAADKRTANILNSTDPDLSGFHARGGKLILYHGWNDPAISAQNTINYYAAVGSKMGVQAVLSFVRLYMVPGMQHCSGGPGASAFGQLGIPTAKGDRYGIFTALEGWVEDGKAPGDGIVATKYVNDNSSGAVISTRPLCVYPMIAKYKGRGDTNDAANFACVSPR